MGLEFYYLPKITFLKSGEKTWIKGCKNEVMNDFYEE